MGTLLLDLLLHLLFFVFEIIWFFLQIIWRILEEIWYWHWHVRRTYQTFLYHFNATNGFKLRKRRLLRLAHKIEFNRTLKFTYEQHFKFLRLFITIIEKRVSDIWYWSWWFSWCWLSYYLYFHDGVRDLGPSHDYYDYNPEGELGLWWTMGYLLVFIWLLWTWVANSAFIISIYLILNKFFLVRLTWRYWYETVINAFFDIHLSNLINAWYETNIIFFTHYSYLFSLTKEYYSTYVYTNILYVISFIMTANVKQTLLWFPWSSYFNLISIFIIFYVLIFINIYSTDNLYYVLLYTMFFVFLLSSLLIILDLDIFAGLLLLIESVVILMLFFLIIYLTPNVSVQIKSQKWKLFGLLSLFIFITSIFSYNNLGTDYFYPFSITSIFLEDFYEALHEINVNDLTGIFVILYWTNSLLLFIIAILLLIASLICVILTSFFTKIRNFDVKSFLTIFNVAKTCYSFIFLRKQNLAKQGRNYASTKIFKKKTFDSKIHAEYREKQEIFEKKKRDEKKKADEAALKEKLTKDATNVI